MSQFISDRLGELFQQAKYAPERQRLLQIDACETLIRLIQAGKKYPFEFVCFHVTGYRPKGLSSQDLIASATLLHDLVNYATGLSRTVHLRHDQFGQKVFTLESLVRKFRVSSKTISRWRQSGLIARYMGLPNGRRGLGFLASSVDLFLQRNRCRVEKGSRFSQLAGNQRDTIALRLRKWADRCPEQRQEALVRTARRFGRSIETVRLILKELEAGQAGSFFEMRSPRVTPTEQQDIFDAFETGTSVPELMKRFGRSRSNVYWAINQARAQQVKSLNIAFIPSDEITGSANPEAFLSCSSDLFESEKTDLAAAAVPANQAVESLTAYVSDISRWPLLNFEQEQFLFRKYNTLKFLAVREQQRIDLNYPQAAPVKRLLQYLRMADAIKNQLIHCNLRLVVSTARKHTRNDTQMLELISEGNIALMNAVEKFDYSRRVKFSTYTTWAMFKRFATLYGSQDKATARLSDAEWLEVAQDRRAPENKVPAIEKARRSLNEIVDRTLDQRERLVLREHYGLAGILEGVGRRKAKSFKAIGDMLDLSKERVRQIELAALQKLRSVLNGDQFDYLIQL